MSAYRVFSSVTVSGRNTTPSPPTRRRGWSLYTSLCYPLNTNEGNENEPLRRPLASFCSVLVSIVISRIRGRTLYFSWLTQPKYYTGKCPECQPFQGTKSTFFRFLLLLAEGKRVDILLVVRRHNGRFLFECCIFQHFLLWNDLVFLEESLLARQKHFACFYHR